MGSAIRKIPITAFGQEVSGIEFAVGESVELNLACQDPDTRTALDLSGGAVQFTLCALDSRGNPQQSPLFSRQATITNPPGTDGLATVPIAPSDTVPSGNPVQPGSHGFDLWFIDGSGNRMQQLAFGILELEPAATLPTTPVTPLPSQTPLAQGPAGPTGDPQQYQQDGGTVFAARPIMNVKSPLIIVDNPGQGRSDLSVDIESELGLFNVVRYGAKGDGIHDDAPAIQDAVNDASAHGGGRIWFPRSVAGYLMESQVALTLDPGPAYPGGAYQKLIFEGAGGSGSPIVCGSASPTSLFDFYGLFLRFVDLLFVPLNTNNDGVPDVQTIIAMGSCFDSLIERCWFNGIRAADSLLTLSDSDVEVRNNTVTGCSADPANALGMVAFTLFATARVINNRFEQSRGCRGQSVSKQAGLANAPDIYLSTPGSAVMTHMVAANNQNTVEIIRNKFSSAYPSQHPAHVLLDHPVYGQPSLKYNRVKIEDNNFDLFDSSARAVVVHDAARTELRRNWCGTSTALGVAFELNNAGDIVLEDNTPENGAGGVAGPTQVSADSSCTSIVSRGDTFADDAGDIGKGYVIADPVATPTTVERQGIRAKLVAAAGAIAVGQLVKPSGTQYTPLAPGDDAALAVGIALDVATNPGDLIRVAMIDGQIVQGLSDGTAIAVGQQVYASSVVGKGGDLTAVAGGAPRGIAITAVGAGSSALFWMQLGFGSGTATLRSAVIAMSMIAPSSIAFTGALVGMKVVSVIGIQTGGVVDFGSQFESIISVAGHIQQTSASSLPDTGNASVLLST